MKETSPMRHALRRSALTVALGNVFRIARLRAERWRQRVRPGGCRVTVTIESPETGFRREVTVGWRWRVPDHRPASPAPTGHASVAPTARPPARDVTVNAGVGVARSTVANAGRWHGGSAEHARHAYASVGVRAVNPIDVSSTESVTILTAEQIARSRCRATPPAWRCSRPGTVAVTPRSATSHRSAARRSPRTSTSSTASTSRTRSAA